MKRTQQWILGCLAPLVIGLAGCQTVQNNQQVAMDNRQMQIEANAAWNDAAEPSVRIAPSGRPRLEPMRPHAIHKVDTQEPLVDDLLGDITPEATQPTSDAKPAFAVAEVATHYTVKKGDSLWSIAKKNNVSLDTLMALNGLNKASVLKVGQQLTVPKPAERTEAQVVVAVPQGAMETYVVRSGDTLSELAIAANMSVAQIQAANNLKKTSIVIGQKLQLPEGTSAKLSSHKEARSSEQAQMDTGHSYKVRPGQTLSDIALITGMPVAQIMELNRITDPRKLRAGQVLKISSEAASKVAAQPAASEPVVVASMGDSSAELQATQPTSEYDALPAEPTTDDDALFEATPEAPVMSVESVQS